MKNPESDLRSLIENFANDVRAAVRASLVEEVREALTGAPAKRGPGRPKGAKSGRRGPGRPPKAASAKTTGRRGRPAKVDSSLNARVLSAIGAQPGRSVSALAETLRTDSASLKRPISQLLAAKQIRKSGERRGTIYFAGKGSTAVAPSAGGASKAPRKKAKAKAKRSPEAQSAIDARMARMRAARVAKAG